MAARSLGEFMAWLEHAPTGTTLVAAHVLDELRQLTPAIEHSGSSIAPSTSWRERLWLAPPDARLGVAEVSEAVGRPKHWVYRHTSRKSGVELLPHRRIDGALTFLAGELRDWLRRYEQRAVPATSAMPTRTFTQPRSSRIVGSRHTLKPRSDAETSET
jgi:hypothetical protein